jgi:hypothetical protein
VSVLGAVLASRVTDLTTDGLTAAGASVSAGEAGIGSLNELPPAIAGIVRAAYGDATALIFLIAGVLAILTFVAVLAIREVPLRTETGMERERIEAQQAGGPVHSDEAGTNESTHDRDRPVARRGRIPS